MKYLHLLLFYTILRKLPGPTVPFVGPPSEWLRYKSCKKIFKKCGKKVNVGCNARFGKGFEIEIGYLSSIGRNCKIPSNIKIGSYVMMGPNVTIHSAAHKFDDVVRPMLLQGILKCEPTEIEDDVWIGSNVIILPGKTIKRGTIIGAGSVVTKDFPEYSIIAGNPAKLIRSRIS